MYEGSFERATRRLEQLENSDERRRFQARGEMLIDLALAQAGLGMVGEASASAEAAIEALPVSVDALDGPDILYDAAGIMTSIGRLDRAVEILGTLFAGPGNPTVAYLRVDPRFDPLRDHAGYVALVEGQ